MTTKTAQDGRSEAMSALRRVEQRFKSHYPQFTYSIQEDHDLEAVELMIEDENDEPTYSSVATITQNYDGSVAIDITRSHSSTGIDFPEGLSPDQIFSKTEAYMKRESDMLGLKQAASAAGKTQKAIMEYLGSHEGTVELSDMARAPAFRGVHFGDIMSAAAALKKKDLIEYNTSVGSSTLKKIAVAPEGWEDTVKKMKKHPEIDNPWALSWFMKNKGDTPGGKEAAAFEHALSVQRVAESFTAATKAFIGEVGRTGYAIKIEGVDPSFLHMPMGRQMDEWQKIKAWQAGAKKDWVLAKPRKGQKRITEMKRWVKSTNPSEYFSKWDTSVDDDSVEIFYK